MDVRSSRTLFIAFAMAGAVVVPSSASAAGWNCSATGLAGQPPVPATSANGGASTCQAASAGGSAPVLPVPLQATAVSAQTQLDGPAGDPVQQIASATSQISGLGISLPSNLPINVAVKKVKPDAAGRFAVTIPAPPSGLAAVYRLQTSVPKSARNPKLFPTYTLPRAVELRR
jgi:hypothetical protein